MSNATESRFVKLIRQVAAAAGYADVNARYIEAHMLRAHGTLDHMTAREFARETGVAISSVLASTEAENEALARSFGL